MARGTDGALRGFSNACRHRGHELLPCGGTTTGRAIVCPYHAWVYGFDGELRGVPALHRGDVPDLSPFSLNPVQDRGVAGLRDGQPVGRRRPAG